ncbi:General transcription factor IIH subunit 2 [Lamellibrachia satsuma]|nr:General transcription factor IIH subunit 2 [Lamellibrachia satsuma]
MDEADAGYTWETEYERTWEVLKEDEKGSLQASVADVIHKAKRKQLLDRPVNVRLGMMRHVFLLLDMSQAMENRDLKPNRLTATLKLLESFIEELFDENPISQVGIIVTSNKRAEKVAELGGNPRRHIATLQKLVKKPCQGEPSLQNSLQLAAQSLRHVPSHTSREILVLYGSLTTCDPGNILDTIKTLKESNIRCSVIGLAAEVRICRKLCHETEGSYHVILDEKHFVDLLKQHVSPPPSHGFPHHQFQQSGVNKEDRPAMCMCHLESKETHGFSSQGYFCPQCMSKYCELPVECKTCALTLVSAPHLARSYHHLFPVDVYEEVLMETVLVDSQKLCKGCQKFVSEPKAYRCPKCRHVFCVDCDVFIHESLHSCPGCASSRAMQHVSS